MLALPDSPSLSPPRLHPANRRLASSLRVARYPYIALLAFSGPRSVADQPAGMCMSAPVGRVHLAVCLY